MNRESGSLSLSEQAYRRIKHDIVSLTLSPGSVINERALREELGFGRTPVREALQRLSLEKLVVIIPRQGTFVTDVSITDLQRLFEVRITLEGLGARLAAQRATPRQWTAMEAVLTDVPATNTEADNEELIAFDQAFHQLIYEAMDNEFLADALTTHYALSLRLWYLALDRIGDVRATVAQHERILAALKARDEARAERRMRRHVRDFQEHITVSLMGADRVVS